MSRSKPWRREGRTALRRLFRDGPTMIMLDKTGPFIPLKQAYRLPFTITVGIVLLSRDGFSVGAEHHLEELLKERFDRPIWAVARAQPAEKVVGERLSIPWELEIFENEEGTQDGCATARKTPFPP